MFLNCGLLWWGALYLISVNIMWFQSQIYSSKQNCSIFWFHALLYGVFTYPSTKFQSKSCLLSFVMAKVNKYLWQLQILVLTVWQEWLLQRSPQHFCFLSSLLLIFPDTNLKRKVFCSVFTVLLKSAVLCCRYFNLWLSMDNWKYSFEICLVFSSVRYLGIRKSFIFPVMLKS